MSKGVCDVEGCNNPAVWRCVDADMLYCDKHKVRHRMSDDSPYHTFEKYIKVSL